MKPEDLTKFVPMTVEEMKARKWDYIDILIITGDAYVDHPSFGPVVIARVLLSAGYKVAIIAQPDWKDPESLKLFGRPRIGCGVSSGNMDSMIKLYTAGRRLRHTDMYSENGQTGKCPPRATIVYAQLAKRAFPKLPVVIGGVDASLRRVAHYDYWQDIFKPSVLVESKADILCFGMGEITMLEIFDKIKKNESLSGIRGTVRYLGGNESAGFKIDENCEVLPSFEEICSDKTAIMRQTKIVERNTNPWNGKRLLQSTNGRLLIIEPARPPLTQEQFDAVSELPYAGLPHFTYKGKIPAWEMIKDSITVVRGCPGGCAFCGLVCHQGRHLVSRSEQSICKSAKKLASQPFFRGTISDIGGPAGNIYGHRPKDPNICKMCKRYSCIFPTFCKNYNADEKPLMHLLDSLKKIDKIKHVFINSGIRLDLALVQPEQTKKIISDHISGQLSIAPEHLDGNVLRLMRKGKEGEFEQFRKIFDEVNAKTGKKQYLIPYFISNFPGCTQAEMKKVDDYLEKSHWNLQQVQDFIPLAMTMGSAMYCSEIDENGNPILVNKGLAQRREQRNMLKREHTNAPMHKSKIFAKPNKNKFGKKHFKK